MSNDPMAQVDARKKYILAFNSTMIRIWQEKLLMLGVFDTGNLYRSVIAIKQAIADQDATEFTLEQEFLSYGLWQNYGTGREVFRGNGGDIGRAKVRRARRWFDKKYFASVMNLKDFFLDSMSAQYLAMMSNAFSDSSLREQASQP